MLEWKCYVFILIFLALKLTILSPLKSLHTDPSSLKRGPHHNHSFSLFLHLAHLSFATNEDIFRILTLRFFNKPATLTLHMMFFSAVLTSKLHRVSAKFLPRSPNSKITLVHDMTVKTKRQENQSPTNTRSAITGSHLGPPWGKSSDLLQITIRTQYQTE